MKSTDGPGRFYDVYLCIKNLPLIVSHVHPRFVICDCGQKLHDIVGLRSFQKADDPELDARLSKVSEIDDFWTRDLEPDFESIPISGHNPRTPCCSEHLTPNIRPLLLLAVNALSSTKTKFWNSPICYSGVLMIR